MPDPARTLSPLPAGLVWRILRRYAASVPGLVSHIDRFGIPRGNPAQRAREWSLTVGAKLERYGAVARVLWLETALSWVQNVYQPAEQHGHDDDLELGLERVEVVDALIEHGLGVKASKAVCRELEHSRDIATGAGEALSWELTWLACELAACADDDPAFLRELEGE